MLGRGDSMAVPPLNTIIFTPAATTERNAASPVMVCQLPADGLSPWVMGGHEYPLPKCRSWLGESAASAIIARRPADLVDYLAAGLVAWLVPEPGDLRGAMPTCGNARTCDERTTVPVDTADGGQVVRLTHLLRLNPPDGRSSHIEWQPEGHRRLWLRGV